MYIYIYKGFATYISKRQVKHRSRGNFFLAFVYTYDTSRALVWPFHLKKKGRVQVDDRVKLISVFYCTISY